MLHPSCCGCFLYRNTTIIEQPINLQALTSKLVMDAKAFIYNNQQNAFFLLFSLPQTHTPMFNHRDFKGKSKRGMQQFFYMICYFTRTLMGEHSCGYSAIYLISQLIIMHRSNWPERWRLKIIIQCDKLFITIIPCISLNQTWQLHCTSEKLSINFPLWQAL